MISMYILIIILIRLAITLWMELFVFIGHKGDGVLILIQVNWISHQLILKRNL